MTLDSPTVSYLICATPRSGSTLLCEALKNSGLAGNPDEYFGPMHVSRWNERWRTDTEHHYLQQVFKHGTGPNGVWGAKVMRLYWQDFLGLLGRIEGTTDLSDTDLLNHFFPWIKFIFITRRNKVRQAVSWLKFVQGAAWFWEKDAPQKLENLEFKPEIIDAFLWQTAVHESAWLEFFNKAGVQPFIVVYEDFVDAYAETAVKILDYLEIDRPRQIAFTERRMKRQADARSDDWVERYLAMKQHTERFGDGKS